MHRDSADDYTVADLCRIFERICIENECSLTSNARAYAFLNFSTVRERHEGAFENARVVRECFESARSFQVERLAARAVPPTPEQSRQLEGVDIITSSLYETELRSRDVSASKWEAECPECHRNVQAAAANLGKRFSCKCGGSFIFPWWNPVRSTIPGLSNQAVKVS